MPNVGNGHDNSRSDAEQREWTRRWLLRTTGGAVAGSALLTGAVYPGIADSDDQVVDGFESGAYDDGDPVTWQVHSIGDYATVQSDIVKNGGYALEEKAGSSTTTNTALYHHADGFTIEDGDVYSAWMRCDGDVPRVDFSFGPEVSKKPAHGVRVGVITDHDHLTMSTHDENNDTLDRHHFGSADPRTWYFFEAEMYPSNGTAIGRVYDSSKNLIGEKTLATTGKTAFEYTNLWMGTPFGRMSIGWFDDVMIPIGESKTYGFRTDGLYVYGRADEIVDEDNNDKEKPRVTHDQFFTAVDRLNASDVFLQWDSLYETEEELISTEKITTFLRKCSNKDIRVHSMVDSSGKEELNRVRPRIKDLIEWQQNRSQDEERFSGLHLDLEPNKMNRISFFSQYKSILNWLKTDSFNKVSIAIGLPGKNPFSNNLFYDVRDHEKVDFLVIMAHTDDAEDARDQIRTIMRNPDGINYSSKDFMWSVLLLEMDEDSRTFYEEGGDAVSQAITSIENPPPISESQYKGTVANAFLALSHYKS